MKKLILHIFLIVPFLFAQSYKIDINFKDGSSLSIPIKNISEIYFDDINTDILKDPTKSQLLTSLILFQNYPNPFNPSTTIKYFLNNPGDAIIEIYSITGVLIKSYSYLNQSVGEHIVTWDAIDQKGNKVASGIYLYKLKVDNKIKIQRMTLVK